MFREMRRRAQALTPEECLEVLERGTHGVLAVSGDDGYPYAVPMSYALSDGRIVFHCAREGHKLDALARSGKASFCVVDRDEIAPEKFTTLYRSVIVFGRVRIAEDEAERRSALALLARKYGPGDPEAEAREVEGALGRVCILVLTPEHMTGKEGRELRQRKQS